MHRAVILTLTFLLFLVLPAFAGAERPAAPPQEGVFVGTKAPNFTLQDMTGKKVSLEDLRGKVVFLNFWATWCPPCRAEMPSMERLHEAMGTKDFALLAVNADADPKEVRDWLKKNPHKFQVLLDDEAVVQEIYGVYRFPETFLIGKDGKILQHYIGARDWSTVEFLKYISSLVKE